MMSLKDREAALCMRFADPNGRLHDFRPHCGHNIQSQVLDVLSVLPFFQDRAP